MDRERFLIVHGADPVRWAKRYGITPASHPCYHCDRQLITTVPFAIDNLRGLVAPDCECGSKRTPYCVVAADGGGILEALDAKDPSP